MAGPISLVTDAPTLPGAEDTQGETLRFAGKPGGVPGDSDGESVTGHAHEECQAHQSGVSVGECDEECGDGGCEEQCRHHDPAAEAVGPHAERQPPECAVENGDGGEPGELSVGEVEFGANGQCENPKHQPHGKQQREGNGREGENATACGGEARPAAMAASEECSAAVARGGLSSWFDMNRSS